MVKLVIDLQEGFDDDSVAVACNGEQITLSNVSTDYSIGRAESLEFDVDLGKANIEINIPGRSLSAAQKIDIRAPVFFGVSVESDQITCKLSNEPFIYF